MKRILGALLPLLLIAGCDARDDRERDSATQGAEDIAPIEGAAPAPASAGTVSDPQIAAIVVSANQVDIEAGQMAEGKANDPAVKEFATRMITDHTAVNEQASALVERLGVTPEPNPTSQQLEERGSEAQGALRSLSGAEFDKAYIDHEVAYHQQVLDALDQTLIPNAQNPELKNLLEQTRPAIEAHLVHAQELQNTLSAP